MYTTANAILNNMVQLLIDNDYIKDSSSVKYKELIINAVACEPLERTEEIENVLDGVMLLKACVETFNNMTPNRKLSYISTAASILSNYVNEETL